MPSRWFAALVGSDRRSPPHAGVATQPPRSATSGPSHHGATLPASVDQGIAAVSVEDLLSANDDLLARIKLSYGASREDFERDLMTPTRAYAAFVNALPATSDNYFCDVGGLLRLGIEIGFFALQGSDAHIIGGRATISTRRTLEPRWRQACFIAGLTLELHRSLGQLIVTDDAGVAWPRYLSGLTPWLQARRSSRFFVRWLADKADVRALGLFALPQVVPPATLQHLDTDNAVVVRQLIASVGGGPIGRDPNPMAELVHRAAALVIHRNLVANESRYGRPILGAHLERYLIDAMRRLVLTHPAWQVNAEKSRLWLGQEGLFLVWPNAADEIRKLLEDDAIPGVPHAAETILEILTSAGVVSSTRDGQALWNIRPPRAAEPLGAIKLCSPDLLLSAFVNDESSSLPGLLAPARSARAPSPSPPLQPQAFPSPSASPHTTVPSASADSSPEDDGLQSPALAPADSLVDLRTGEIVSRAAAVPPLRFVRPPRLPARVGDAITDAIDSMNGGADAVAAITTVDGVFIPITHFHACGVSTPELLRALADAGLTVDEAPGKVSVVTRDWLGESRSGIVMRPCCVDGLDPLAFRHPSA